MIRRSRHDAACNRIVIGSAPRFGSEVCELPDDIPPERQWSWLPHESMACWARAWRPKLGRAR